MAEVGEILGELLFALALEKATRLQHGRLVRPAPHKRDATGAFIVFCTSVAAAFFTFSDRGLSGRPWRREAHCPHRRVRLLLLVV